MAASFLRIHYRRKAEESQAERREKLETAVNSESLLFPDEEEEEIDELDFGDAA